MPTPPQPKTATLLHNVRTLPKKRWARFVLLFVVSYLILTSFFFSEVMKNFNNLELLPRDVLLPMFVHAMTALFVTLALFWWRQPQSLAGKLVAVSTLSLFMVGYDDRLMAVAGVFRAMLPILPEQGTDLAIISLLFLAILATTSHFLGVAAERLVAKAPSIQPLQISLAVLIVVGFVFIGQATPVIGAWTTAVAQSQATSPELPKANGVAQVQGTEKPDIYYIIFDRYTNDDVLQSQFSFDNSHMASFLRTNGFTLNQSAHAAYPYTAMSVASTLNASYTKDATEPFKNNDMQSRSTYHSLVYDASVVKALKEAGYEYHMVGSDYATSNRAPLADKDWVQKRVVKLFGKPVKRLHNLEVSTYIKSPFYRFTKLDAIPWWPINTEELDDISFARAQFNALDTLASSEQQGGRFIFAHILLPHSPFFFNADGSTSLHPEPNSHGKAVKQKYTDQVQFINNQIQDTIATIREESGNKAVVLLNADEGPYPNAINMTFKDPLSGAPQDVIEVGDMSAWPDDWLHMKYGIQQAVHIPQASEQDLQQLNSVNLFRIVLNRYAGYNLDYLPTCHFALNRGSLYEFNYVDITSRFQGETSDYCQSLQSIR